MSDFKIDSAINCTPEECVNALTRDIPSWWTEGFEGRADITGSRFTVRFGNSFKTMEVAELAPKKIVWRCVESYLDLDTLKNKAEWNGTDIVWSITAQERGIVLTVEHQGLTPAMGCYDACEQGWLHFFNRSLRPYLEDGKGQPFLAAS